MDGGGVCTYKPHDFGPDKVVIGCELEPWGCSRCLRVDFLLLFSVPVTSSKEAIDFMDVSSAHLFDTMRAIETSGHSSSGRMCTFHGISTDC